MAREIVEDLLGCKWSLAVIDAARLGIVRPGAMERHIDGISKKVLNERLRKLVRYGVVERKELASRPLHVEYPLTPFGLRLLDVLDAIDGLEIQDPADPEANGTRGSEGDPLDRN
ncbi:MAG: helix-turn-helix transcriptional regulator [Deltaproteobacteria bacterium]|nr:helix-turn-helix transcriptional regulator [Deltaproteobacteria bacterium]